MIACARSATWSLAKMAEMWLATVSGAIDIRRAMTAFRAPAVRQCVHGGVGL